MRSFALILLALAGLAQAAEPRAILTFPDSLRGTSDAGALLTFAGDCEAQGAYDLAAEALEAASLLRPEETGLRVRLAENAYRAGASGKPRAFEVANELLASSAAPTDHKARAGMVRALILFERGLVGEARAGFEEVLSLESGNARAAIGLAAAEAATGDLLPASARLDALGSAAQPYDVETRYLMRVALDTFGKERRTFTDAPDNHAAYGKLLYRAGRLPEAILALRRAATLRGNDTATWNLVAAIAAQIGDAATTRTACEASLAIKPEQPEIAKLLESVSKTQ